MKKFILIIILLFLWFIIECVKHESATRSETYTTSTFIPKPSYKFIDYINLWEREIKEYIEETNGHKQRNTNR